MKKKYKNKYNGSGKNNVDTVTLENNINKISVSGPRSLS